MIVNRIELASVLGVSAPTVDKRVEEGMPFVDRPDTAKGSREWRFETADVIKWLVTEGGKGTKESARDNAELRERVAIASLKELELGQRQKVLVHVDEVAEVVNEQFAVIKSRMQAIPSRLAQQIAIESDPVKCRSMLREEVNLALEAIASEDIEENPEEPGDSGDNPDV